MHNVQYVLHTSADSHIFTIKYNQEHEPGKLLDTCGYLDSAALPVAVRVSISPTNTLPAAAVLARSIDADVCEVEVPSLACYCFQVLCLPLLLSSFLVLAFLLQLCISGLDGGKTLFTRSFLCGSPFEEDKLGVWDSVIGREECGREDVCCIRTSKLA